MLFFRQFVRLIIWLVGSYAVQAEPATIISMGAGNSIPPYVIPEKDRGIVVDIFREAMLQEDIDTEFVYSDNSSNTTAFNEGKLGVLLIANRATTPDAYFSSKPLVVFSNQAIVLKASKIILKDVSDLGGYRLGAFRMAQRFLPEPYAATVKKSPSYREYPQQAQQVSDLFHHDRQVLIIDHLIFRYYVSQMRRQDPSSDVYHQEYEYFDLFPKTRYFAAFRDQSMRDAFDRGFAKLKKSGRYERILATYQSLLDGYLFR